MPPNKDLSNYAVEKIYQEWTAGPLYVAKGLIIRLFWCCSTDMGAPTSDSRSHKDRGVLRNWDTQDENSHTAREIDIWMDRLVSQHDRLDLIKPPQPVTNL